MCLNAFVGVIVFYNMTPPGAVKVIYGVKGAIYKLVLIVSYSINCHPLGVGKSAMLFLT